MYTLWKEKSFEGRRAIHDLPVSALSYQTGIVKAISIRRGFSQYILCKKEEISLMMLSCPAVPSYSILGPPLSDMTKPRYSIRPSGKNSRPRIPPQVRASPSGSVGGNLHSTANAPSQPATIAGFRFLFCLKNSATDLKEAGFSPSTSGSLPYIPIRSLSLWATSCLPLSTRSCRIFFSFSEASPDHGDSTAVAL